jgi:hypothetical protein
LPVVVTVAEVQAALYSRPASNGSINLASIVGLPASCQGILLGSLPWLSTRNFLRPHR